jgi:peroxiredoxin Q/BCP
MKRLLVVMWASCVLASPLYAELKPGVTAPDFTTQATLAGQPFTFALATALKSGPVVLYFYPAAFTHTTSPRPLINSSPWVRP